MSLSSVSVIAERTAVAVDKIIGQNSPQLQPNRLGLFVSQAERLNGRLVNGQRDPQDYARVGTGRAHPGSVGRVWPSTLPVVIP